MPVAEGAVATERRGSVAAYDVLAEREVMAPMRDGVRLATDLYLPATGGARAPGRARAAGAAPRRAAARGRPARRRARRWTRGGAAHAEPSDGGTAASGTGERTQTGRPPAPTSRRGPKSGPTCTPRGWAA